MPTTAAILSLLDLCVYLIWVYKTDLQVVCDIALITIFKQESPAVADKPTRRGVM